MKRDQWTIVLAGLLAVACTTHLRADDVRAPDWQPYFRDLARSYRIAPDATPDELFTLHEPPVLRWNQPVRGGDDGAVFVWLQDGRPAAIGTMFCWPHAEGYRVVVNEFHSFLSEPLTALRGEETAWTPQDGITWQDFEEAPGPAATAARRLIQMRQLAGRFRGENRDDQGDGEKWELRLLPQPLFRYNQAERVQSAENPVLDGALFALASGTDPEILLLIEVRMTGEGDRWRWALARFSDRPLTAWLDDEEVWTVDRALPTRETGHTYFDVDRLVRPPEEVAEP